MSESARLRIFPVAIAAIGALAVLKAGGLIFAGGYALSPVSVAVAQDAAAPDAGAQDAAAADGAAGEAEGGEPEPLAASEPEPMSVDMTEAAHSPQPLSESERAVLESLRERREELEERERALLMRENLLRAAEERVDQKVAELKAIERRIQASIQTKEEADDAQFADLVTMYETMKPKPAAKIFDRLDIDVIVGVARRMNPEALADILARMDPAMAERVTIELAQISERGTGILNELAPVSTQ